METLDKKDIQGLLLRAYKDLGSSGFLLCKISDNNSFKEFLSKVHSQITNSEKNPTSGAMNIAFTNNGFTQLGLKMKRNFSSEFSEGMQSKFRQRILGDYNSNDPEKWIWGAQSEIHFILMLYAPNTNAINAKVEEMQSLLAVHKVTIVQSIISDDLEGDKEHFGFHDGISQPVIRSLKGKKVSSKSNVVADGEFIFGYLNEYDKMPISPILDSPDQFDFGKNGSYMVFRQLKQNVKEFWNYMSTQSGGDINEAIHLASKMMGRYLNGTPLALSPDKPDAKLAEENNFGYYSTDKFGEKCPFGAHVRKANPRDGMNDDPVESTTVTNRHRILRRGRPYGAPCAPSMNPEDILKAAQPAHEVGLVFICFNTNISRQFEFVQQQWMNNKKFYHLYNDPDPIVGIDGKPPVNGVSKAEPPGEFTIQNCPVRKKLTGVPQFTVMKGGAYFFFPAIGAISRLIDSIH
ncbi:peroxidase [Cytophagales bacterium WSM2-2]|nr:peroxidase [Cytophagales bacterium WSM2-2]